MRKYQQLFLIAISLISIAALLLYRSENDRLKYVLDVVNFFGQRADGRLSSDASFEYTTPFPSWQRIGKGFHAYAAYWHWDPAAGPAAGEVIAIAVGLKHSIVGFRCAITSGGGNGSRPVLLAGRFGFNREQLPVDGAADYAKIPAAANTGADATDEYILYKFICKVANVSGSAAPQRVHFTDLSTQQQHSLGLRDLSRRRVMTSAALYKKEPPYQKMVMCVNLVSPLQPALTDFYYAGNAIADRQLLEFFLHHWAYGLDEFIVYDSFNRMSVALKKQLAANGVRVNYLPFNFPFALEANSERDAGKIRHILQLDCEMRTVKVSRWCLLAQPNERLYMDSGVQDGNATTFVFENSYTDDVERGLRLALNTNTVCLNLTAHAVATTTMTVEDDLYVADAGDELPAVDGRSTTTGKMLVVQASVVRPVSEVAPSVYRLFANRYVACKQMDRNTEVTHNIWPATIEPWISQSFMFYIEKIVRETKRLLAKTTQIA